MPKFKKQKVSLGDKGSFKIRKGAYHAATGIPEGKKIPMSRINKDIKKGGAIGKMAKSAKGLKAMG
jgi:hypothetical protein